MSDTYSRRRFLAATAAAAGLGPVLAACGGGGAPTAASCEGYDQLTPADLQSRQALQYVDQTTDAEKHCATCRLYTAPTGGSPCGGCQLFQGPVSPKGWCSGWVAQA